MKGRIFEVKFRCTKQRLMEFCRADYHKYFCLRACKLLTYMD